MFTISINNSKFMQILCNESESQGYKMTQISRVPFTHVHEARLRTLMKIYDLTIQGLWLCWLNNCHAYFSEQKLGWKVPDINTSPIQ
jgi:hypothetical protein